MSEEQVGAIVPVKTPGDETDPDQAFVQRITALARANKSALGRNAGCTMAQSRGVNWFIGTLRSPERGRDEEIHFLVATLMPLNTKRPRGKDLGETFAILASLASREAVERRFNVLLDAQFDLVDGWKPGGGELAFRLRQMVRLAASKELGIPWAQLLRDLKDWSYPEKRVQKRWAAAFYAPSTGAAPRTDSPNEPA